MKRILKELIRDEKKAPHEYKELLKHAHGHNRTTIKGIIKDENRHLLSLKKMKRRL